jgi:hypothetical protein
MVLVMADGCIWGESSLRLIMVNPTMVIWIYTNAMEESAIKNLSDDHKLFAQLLGEQT